jgi:prepilin-type N-terminal cleavage/methylation domain-containing protein
MALGEGKRPVDAGGPVSTRAAGPRGGFTLVEVLVAVVVLAIGAAGLIQLLSQAQQQNDRRRSSEVARRIAENEVQRARGAGAWNVPAVGAPTRVDQNGTPDVDGEYRVYVDRDLFCDPSSTRLNDTGGPPPPCAGAFAQITVRVEHFRAGAWSTRANQVLLESGTSPASGSWTLAGTP